MRSTWVLLFLVLFSFSGFTLDFYCNDSLWASYHEEELNTLLYEIPLSGEQSRNGNDDSLESSTHSPSRGISLDELFPVLIDAYRLSVTAETKSDDVYDDTLAEKLHSFYLLKSSNGWDLQIGTKHYSDVVSLTIYGERVDDTNLEVWVSWEEVELLKQEIARFSKLHKLNIKVTEVPKTDSKLVSIVRGGGPMPDVVMVQSDYLGRLTASEALQPVDYLSTQPLLSNGERAFTLDSRQWAVPFYFDSQLVFLNTDLIHTVPSPRWTLFDFEQTCEDLKEKGVIPSVWNAYSAYWLIPFQKGFGKTDIVEPDGSIVINDEPTKKALHYILSLEEKGYLDTRERDGMISMFISGEIGMILSGSYSIPYFQDLGINFAAVNYPYNEKTGRPLSPMLDFKGFAITRKTRHPILAARLIQFLTGAGVQQRFPIQATKLPTNTETWHLLRQDDPLYGALLRSAAVGTVVPPQPSYAIYKNTMWKLLRFVISGQMSVESALDQGQAIINRKLK